MKCVRLSLFVAICFMAVFVVHSLGGESSSREVGKGTSAMLQPGEVIIKFKPNVEAKGREALTSTGIASFDQKLNRFLVQEVRKTFKHRAIPNGSGLPDLSRIYTLRFPSHLNPQQVAGEFVKDPNIEYAEPVWIDVVEEVPNDPMFSQQTYLARVKAVQGWDVQHGDSTVVIAINDNGTDWEHVDLRDNIWTNQAEASGASGIDDDGNGYVDDIHGYDLAENDNNPTNAPQDPLGYWMHGTHTGGIASAMTNNGIGVAGMAWNCEIMPVKISYDVSPRYTHFGYQGIIYAAENGADIISNSWGSASSYSQASQDVIDYAYGLGSIVVCSGGNSGLEEFHYPSGYANALSVCWTDGTDKQVGTYGISIDVCAPGSNILNTYPDDTYDRAGGSSMSCPLAAGLCGLVKSQHPDWSHDQIVRQVVLTADNIDAANPGIEGLLGNGRVNAYKALTQTELTEVPPHIRGFEFTTSDAVNGDGDGLYERGETINVTARYRNYSLGAATNFNVILNTDDPDLTVADGTSFIGTFPPDTFQTTKDPLSFSIAADADPHMASLFVSFAADGGISRSDTFSVTIGKMPVLLVDDDDGDHNVEGYYTTVFDELGILYGVWNHANQGSPTPFILSNFPVVVWSCEWTFPSLDDGDRAALADYLDNGGNLFISGQDIGWDFNEGDRSEFVDFYETYLHAVFYADDSGIQNVVGIAGDEIGEGLSFDIYQPGRNADQQFPDEIEPGPGASAVFTYAGGQNHKGGIRYQGDHRIVYFAFGFEAIDATAFPDPGQLSAVRTEVMTRVLDWVNFIRHDPLKDSEDTHITYPVEVTVTGDISDLAAVRLFWKKSTSPSYSQVVMTHQGEGVYTGTIAAPGTETTIQYYITTDNPYYTWQSPLGAPADVYSFAVQPDVTPPEILMVDQLPDSYIQSGAAEVMAKVIDNLGISEVKLFYRANEEPATGVLMTPTGMGGEYRATLEWSGEFGDVVTYYVEAIDASGSRNTTTSGELSFDIVSYLKLDDFEAGTGGWDLGTGWGIVPLFGVDNSNAMTDSPAGDYSDHSDNPLTYERAFDLADFENAVLTFRHFYYFEEGKDFGYVEASADGENWEVLDEFTGTLAYPVQPGSVRLDEFCGSGNENVQIRFRVASDASGTADGWTIDEVAIGFNVGGCQNKGDATGDGTINILDVLAVANHLLGIKLLDDDDAICRGDCNGDGTINILDCLNIANVLLGIIPACPGGCAKTVVTPETMKLMESLRPYLSPEDFSQIMALVKGEVALPAEFGLAQNYPNPFNPTTAINYQIPMTKSQPHVTLKIYNILGQEVATLVDEIKAAGTYSVKWDASQMASGIYFYRLEAGSYSATRQMVFMK